MRTPLLPLFAALFFCTTASAAPGDTIPYSIFGVFVMPGEDVEISVPEDDVKMRAQSGDLSEKSPGKWRWQAPRDPGVTRLWATHSKTGKRILLNAFIKTPFGYDKETLNGYRIGHYEAKALRGDPVYNRPPGFIEVTEANRNTRVSPHFTLGQFLCHQQDGPPRYLVLREALVLKLERILADLNAGGRALDTLFVMSGYRTPWYNRHIGNRTKYSRHLYGGAADIFPDGDNDGRMDDLNGDGVVNRRDAEVLAALVEAHPGNAGEQRLIGGIGIYGPAPHRGPFVHVDVRGYQARW